MRIDLSLLTVAQIEKKYMRPERIPSRTILAKLRADPRQGVQALYRKARHRHRQRQRERRRLASLLRMEREFWARGVQYVAGVDEAGVGPLAGPVVAAAVVFSPGTVIEGIDDSKRLLPEARLQLAEEIRSRAVAIGVGTASVAEIGQLNIYWAALLAMRRAVESLACKPELVLVDARLIPGVDVPQQPVTGGDRLHFSIAAASILAKTHRDALMVELDRHFPGYGFARHKGYCTPAHQRALRKLGPCPIHRASYPYLRNLSKGRAGVRQLSLLPPARSASRDR